MSQQTHLFRPFPPLQHITKVRIIELLLTRIPERIHLKYFYAPGPNAPGLRKSVHFHQSFLTNVLRPKLASLPLPAALITDLQFFLAPMFNRAADWLTQTTLDPQLDHTQDSWPPTIADFIDNMSFDPFGCVDGRKILKSFVSDLIVVNYWTWEQLCFYCLEEEVTKFAITSDWEGCHEVIDTPYPVYWYWRVYNLLPPPNMFTKAFYPVFMKKLHERALTRAMIVSTIFKTMALKERRSRAFAGLCYLQCLDDPESEGLLVDAAFLECQHADVVVQFLRDLDEIMAYGFANTRHNVWALRALINWPWVLFIDEWIGILEIVDQSFFEDFFRNERIPASDIEQDGQVNENLLMIVKKIVGIFLARFSEDNRVLEEAFWNVFCCESVLMCKVLVDNLGADRRKFLMEAVGNRELFRTRYKRFAERFCEEVLMEEERPLFRMVLGRLG